jgi:hypothetical protein
MNKHTISIGRIFGIQNVKNDTAIAPWIHDSLPNGWYPVHSYER